MLASVVQIGNSRGIRLPKSIIHELKIKDEVELINILFVLLILLNGVFCPY
jgi:antitoxin component of MazEF toxin-antitoxin module